ncbi:hypothetical protein [Schwartzia succinivorans]|uniref:hypothetical protein n=1 Tax=Schwartzia succinivorans TaxID=55507 RepID=UPI0023534F2C|nr:hypothetical protein [Schwartzia succinivorans]
METIHLTQEERVQLEKEGFNVDQIDHSCPEFEMLSDEEKEEFYAEMIERENS